MASTIPLWPRLYQREVFFTTEREHRRWALGADDGDTKDFDASFEDELRC